MKRNNIILLCLIVLGLPSLAYANAGSPLLLLGTLYLLVGNLGIGIMEAEIMAKIFHIKDRKMHSKITIILILANYFSAWVGGCAIEQSVTDTFPVTILNIKIWPIAMLLLTYIVTLILEWPFIALCFRGTVGWLRKSIKASIYVQTASYLVLALGCCLISTMSLVTSTNIVPCSEMNVSKQVFMYYISTTDGDVYLRHLATGDEKKIFTLNSTGTNDRLLAIPSEKNSGQFDIVARLETSKSLNELSHFNPKIYPSGAFNDIIYPNGPFYSSNKQVAIIVIQPSLSIRVAQEKKDSNNNILPYHGTWRNMYVSSFVNSENSTWHISTGTWAFEGIGGFNNKTKESFQFGVETPFAMWYIRNAVRLSDDQVLFQLGEHQICLLDITTKKLALIVDHGRGPVPIMEKENK